MEIAPGIHQIKCLFGANRLVFVYLLIGENAAMLVDTACAHNPEQDILPYMDKIGFDPKRLTYILMTHSDTDHQGGNQPMKKAAPQALFVGHNLDRPWLDSTDALINGRYSQFEQDHGIGYGDAAKASMRVECLSVPLDLTIEGGERFRLGSDWVVEAVHTPGHTWGHTAVYDPRSKVLIAGEAGLWNAILDNDWNPAMPPTYCYVDTYLATQEHLMAMDIQLYASAHWPNRQGSEVAEFIRESRNYCLLVEQKLLDFARDHGPYTLREAIFTVGSHLGTWPEGATQDFSYGMLGNLNRLANRGLLKTGRKEGLVTWSLP